MEVTINAKVDTSDPIPVVIKGNGPSFADGSFTKTVPCTSGVYKFDIKANAKAGCYSVCVGPTNFPRRIRVIEAVATFRANPNDTFSADNNFPGKNGCADNGLGVGRDYYGARIDSIVNTMELRYTLNPKDGCDCAFDIKRTKDVKEFENGVTVRPRAGDDDSHNQDEDLTPSAAGNIYSFDAPGMHQPVGGANGDSREYRAHFTEWLAIRNKGALERCSSDTIWESHLFVENVAGVWTVIPAKSNLSTGHDIPLVSQD